MTEDERLRWPTLAWYAAVAAALLWGPGLLAFGQPFWALPYDNLLLISALTGVFVLCAVASWAAGGDGNGPDLRAAASLAAAGLALVYLLFLLMSDPIYSRLALAAGSGLFGVGLLVPALAKQSPRRVLLLALAGLGAVAAGLVALGAAAGGDTGMRAALERVVHGLTGSDGPEPPAREEEIVATTRHTVLATFYRDRLPPRREPRVWGGALAPDPTGPGLFLARPRGQVFRVSWDETARLDLRDTGLRIPVNNRAFERAVGPAVNARWFRVADLLALQQDDAVRLVASHHHWRADEACFVVRLSSVVLPAGAAASGSAGWSTLFESRPCLPLVHGSRGLPFAGLQVGGNLAAVTPDSVLLTVGDHEFDGWNKPTDYVRDPSAHYGKTVLVDLAGGGSKVFTTGHRNPQGLAVDAAGRIWSTEHGPEGGDELNLLRRGGDYGWPWRTYGTEYGAVTWPPGDTVDPGDHDFVPPVHAWVPSIGVSEVLPVGSESRFRRWRGDLLVAALRGRELWRLEFDGERVAYAEPIPVGERIRDLAATDDGALALWTDRATLVRLAPAVARDRGSTIFARRCAGCHGMPYGARPEIGPDLADVFERGIASAKGFAYSPALEALEGRWTEQRMDAYLADPDSLVPGTTMDFEGIRDAGARRAVIRYLRSLERE